jgi:hypothetical protein
MLWPPDLRTSYQKHVHFEIFGVGKSVSGPENENVSILIIGCYRGLKISRYVFFYFEKLFARATIHVSKVEKRPIHYSLWSLYFIMDPSDKYIIEKSKSSAFKRYRNFGGKLEFLIYNLTHTNPLIHYSY